jgi:hypothetical protein
MIYRRESIDNFLTPQATRSKVKRQSKRGIAHHIDYVEHLVNLVHKCYL